MSSQEELDEPTSRGDFQGPNASNRPIPTIQKYRAEQDHREERQKATAQAQHEEADDPTYKRAYHAAKDVAQGKDEPQPSTHNPYPTTNRNTNDPVQTGQENKVQSTDAQPTDQSQPLHQTQGRRENGKQDEHHKSVTDAVVGPINGKQKRKNMKHFKPNDGGREVTDPVTHLPIFIKDSTVKDLEKAPENDPEPGSVPRTATGLSGATKSQDQLDEERSQLQQERDRVRHWPWVRAQLAKKSILVADMGLFKLSLL